MKAKYIISTLIVLVAFLYSCSEDFLELKPRTAQTSETFFNTSQDAYSALIGVYEKLRSDRPNVYEPMSLIGDILSDDAYAGGGSPSDMLSFQKISRFTEETNGSVGVGLWRKCYSAIQRSNTLLANYDIIEFKESEAGIKASYQAEATFLRGHFYFELVRFFENVPLILEPLEGEEWAEIVQSPPQDVYAQLTKDMMDAIPVLATSYGDSDLGRITKWAAQAELLKVFLFYTGYYGASELPVAGGGSVTLSDAISMAEDIINNSGHALMADYASIFKVEGQFSEEMVFEIPFTTTGTGDWDSDSPLGNIGCQMSGPRGHESALLAQGWSFNIPSHEIYNAFEDGDPRRAATIVTAKELLDINGSLTAGYTHTGLFTFKYTTHGDRKSSVGEPALNWPINYHYIRFADVLLMAAEMHLSNGNQGMADEYVNRVRARVGMPALSSVSLDDIYDERRVELAMEGQRYFDVLRRGVSYAKQELDNTGYTLSQPMATGDLYINDKGQNLTADIGNVADFEVNFDTSKKGFLPIPQNEIDLNSNLVQNSGY